MNPTLRGYSEKSTDDNGAYKRPPIEDFIAETIPAVNNVDTEVFFRRVTDDTLGLLKPEYGTLVLDVAGGLGIDSCILASRGFKVVTLEPMARMVGYSLKHQRERGQSSIHARGYAEEIPIRDESVDQVLCKGSLDHFIDPRAALREMRRVLKPGGRCVLAIANYDSLSCYYSKLVDKIKLIRNGPPPATAPRPTYEPPLDHVTRFNAKIFRHMVGEYFKIEREVGIGILWGAPYLNMFWDRFKKPTAEKALNAIYDFARHVPSLADMTALDCVKE